MVLVLVLDWNGLAFTRDCCAALSRQSVAADMRVLVVDNGSTEHNADDLARACPGAEIVRAPSNLGFSGGIAWGLKHGKVASEPFSHLWLLNNDTIPAPDALEKMLAAASRRWEVAAVGCPLLAPDDATGSSSPCSMQIRAPFWIPQSGEPPDYLCGASLLISKPALDALGPPDTAFPFFFEDADWCFRARRAGWCLEVAHEASVVHLGSATIGRMGERRAELYREGWVRFLRRHARMPFLSSLPATLWRLCADGFRLRLPEVRGTVRGFFQGWTGGL